MSNYIKYVGTNVDGSTKTYSIVGKQGGTETITFTASKKTGESLSTDCTVNVKHTFPLIKHEAVPADCRNKGNDEYWTCPGCQNFFTDSSGNNKIDGKPTTPALGHKYSAEWQSDENYHWHECSVCHDSNYKNSTGPHVWNDGTVTQEPTEETEGVKTYICNVCSKTKTEPIGRLEHILTAHVAVPATCTKNGNKEYWTCTNCSKIFGDSEGKTEISLSETVIPAAHTLEHKAATEATCTENGNNEHWHCTVCGKYFSDSEGKTEISLNDTVIPAAHTLEKTEAKAPTCTENGNIEYWTCSECNKTFSDEYGSTEITNTVISKTGHSMTHTERKAPTCINDGNIEYWTCSNCHKYFSDSAGTNEITLSDTVQAATGIHNYVDGVCTVCGGSDPNYSEPTETSPSETEPPVTEPTGTDPSVTEPPVTDPSDTDSSVTEPPATDPTDTDPSITEPPVTDPSGTEPTATVPSVTEPAGTEPTVTEPIVTEPTYTYTVPTFTQPPVTYPPYTPPTPAPAVTETAVQSDREQPFIQGDSGKSGWDVISDIISDTPDGGTVTVDMNNSTMLPKDIVSQIKGRDIDLILIMKNKFVWTINGTNVTDPKTVNMKVQRSVNISASTVEEYFGDTETVQIRLAHNGDFGFTAELSVSLGSIYNGMTASSYCYKAGKFSFGDSGEISDRTAKLKFNHASNWLIAITDTAAEDVSADAGISAKGDPVGSGRSISLLLLTVIPILGAAFVCIKRSRQK